MKLMIISDIHGIKTNLDMIKEKFKKLKCDKLIVLGDLYYGGQHDKVKDYDVEYVKKSLESYKNKIICIKGNCDSKYDVEMSNFKIINELGIISAINNDLYLTHGHIYNESNWNKINSILIYGHLHIPFIKKIETNIYINPGSISLPRNNYKPTYLIYNEESFVIYDIDNNIVDSINLIKNNK